MTYENILIMEDFNIHYNDLNNPDTQMFSDTIIALGLEQRVNLFTHRWGNTINLVFTEGLSTLRVNAVTPSPYFSDHCVIKLIVSVPKPEMERKSVKFRKTAEIDPPSFVSDSDLTGLKSEEDLNILVDKYSRELRRVLHIHAPEIE